MSEITQIDRMIDSDSIVSSCNCHTQSPDIKHHKKGCKYRLIGERDRAMMELEVERIRLAACGVVALADTEGSRIEARKMNDSYRSGSLNDVIRRVDECIYLRKEVKFWKWIAGSFIFNFVVLVITDYFKGV